MRPRTEMPARCTELTSPETSGCHQSRSWPAATLRYAQVVGSQVTGNEIHFRVAGERVARIPLKQLVAQMKEDVLRRKDWLVKFPVHRGTVGPIGGFSMTYVVQRQAVIERLRQRHVDDHAREPAIEGSRHRQIRREGLRVSR